MTDRKMINDSELEDVVGGALRWRAGKVCPKDDPTHIYTYTNFAACTDYIKNYWDGSAHTEETLKMLEAVGLVKKAY